MKETAVDELDRRIVNALQIQPRATWSKVAAILGIGEVTAARRWARLQEAGLVWVTAYPDTSAPTGSSAVVEVECAGTTTSVAEKLVRDPECFTIDVTAGGRDLLVTVVGADHEALADYALDTIARLDGVRSVRTHVLAGILTDASAWRLRELTEDQVARLSEDPPEPVSQPVPWSCLSELESAICAELVLDGRASATEIAKRVGAPVRRVRETIARLIRTRRAVLRTEISRSASGWPISAWYFVRVPAGRVQRVASLLSRLPEIRTVFVTVGPTNIVLNVWLRNINEVSRLEAAIEEQLEQVEIVDRSVVLRTPKLAANILDNQGRRSRGPTRSPEGKLRIPW
ncbi:Lrp/AsnC family transcriptional regulator [Nocardiopsis salina]|uniref:Lrp/AsnC family transcriptional regulator n=1 Tax=Nocardiopsis salina TaxID=245836 RepID=UPI000345E763|nr:Lrp/AsnC family transcriptional regulator [Nocardiopsis salina]